MIMSPSDTALKAPNQSVAAANGATYGFLFQWPEQFAELVHRFLSGPGEDWAA